MRPATTIFLALAASGLGLYAYLDHTGALNKLFGEKADPPFIIPIAKTITKISLQDAALTRTLEKREDDWYLTEPVEDRADPAWVEKVLETLGAIRPNDYRWDRAEENRAAFGLNRDAATTLTVEFTEGPPVVYQLGGQGPFENSTYLYLGQPESYEGTFVAAGSFSEMMSKPVKEMVDPVLARFEDAKIIGLTLDRPRSQIDLRRNENSGSLWRIEVPVQHQADDDAVNGWLASLANLAVKDALLETPTGEESTEVSFETQTVQIWPSNPQNVIKLTFEPHPTDSELVRVTNSRRSLRYDLPKSVLDDFPTSAEALRESRLLRVLAADIESATLTARGRGPVELENTGGAWFVRDAVGDSTLANSEQGDRFISLLNETKIDQYLTGGADKFDLYGLNDPVFTMQLVGSDLGPLQTEELTMRVGMPPGNSPNAFVTFDGVDYIAAVPKAFLTGMEQASRREKWKKLEVLNVAFDLIEEISMTPTAEPDKALRLVVDYLSVDDKLQLFQGAVNRTDDMVGPAAGQIIMELGNLSCDRWMPVTAEATTTLATPSLTVALKARAETKEDEATTWTLHFAPVNPQVPSFYYGRLEGTERPEPFLISSDLYDRLAGKKLLLE